MYTKGKWKNERYGATIAIWAVPEGGMKTMVAKVNDSNRDMEANARLIAAAPELLEACKGALDKFDVIAAKMGCSTQGTDCDTLTVRQLLETTIARAGGE